MYQPDNQAELADIINYQVIRGRRTSSELGKWWTARRSYRERPQPWPGWPAT
ncbi:hypothetical protein GLE_3929 [Lysobacter enzymogenes]|uniref:Uncharacterized protein n=1 Tax=Lysobacter enzymogenes TaxID=69 RepID=A0A0S2DL35_LYSEN|nr:hypothetical protein GLE_3929 [Lysobacter enzymogenes]